MARAVAEYWNHNTAYHRWLVGIAASHRGEVLDVGCGEGLLVQRLAPVSRRVLGIDPDGASVERARRRLESLGNASVRVARFEELAAADARFDVITFVASLHHLSLVPALTTARQLLRPGGELAVVGLAANRSFADWLWSGLCLPAVRVGSALHRETRDIGVAVAEPGEGLAEIRRLAGELLPGVVVRRGLYYRYLLRWRKSVVGAA